MALEIRIVSPEWEQPLADFFATIRTSDERYFHPHPFTDESAKKVARYSGRDLYYLLTERKTVLAYGILRGWDDNYEVPSLGIAVLPKARGGKLGELMMHFLHCAAHQKGARQVRLKVYGGNAPALSLYTKLGYRFDSVEQDGQLVGRLQL